MSEVAAWTCEFLPGEGGALDSLTVGSRFVWKCHGDLAVQWDTTASPELVFAKPEDQYSLAILKTVRQEPNDVQYEVTAYKAGEHAPAYIRVLQGKGTATERGFEVVSPKWATKSVLDPKQQPPQAYASLGPWNLTVPIWVWILLALSVTALIYGVIRRFRRYSQRKKMLEELARHKTALLPVHQFFKDARQLRRRLHGAKDSADRAKIAEDLDREFRLFILRRFQIPALDWSPAEIVSDLRRRHRKSHEVGRDSLKRTLRELNKIKGRGNIQTQDLEQLLRMTLDSVERFETVEVRR